jgi:hypothetical protein
MPRFWRNESSAIVIIAALTLPVLLGATAVAIDMMRVQDAHMHAQRAADAAALAAARIGSTDKKAARQMARKVFRNNYRKNQEGVTLDLIRPGVNDKRVRLVVEQTIPTTFGKIFGISGFKDRVVAEVGFFSEQPTEVALVVDTTNSMNFTTADWEKWAGELKAMTDSLTASGKSYVTLVEFKDHVNLGTSQTDWLTPDRPDPWYGCVWPRGARTKPEFDEGLTDLTPFEMPFEASLHQAPMAEPDRRVACNGKRSIIGPTKSGEDIKKAIDGVWFGGTGRFDVAMAWAWRVLSPRWRGLWGPAGYPGKYKDTRKIVVFITDGRTKGYTRYFYGQDVGDLGDNDGSINHFAAMNEVCRRMKDEGIEIRIIQAGDRSMKAQPYLEDCASPGQFSTAVEIDDVIKAVNNATGVASGGMSLRR